MLSECSFLGSGRSCCKVLPPCNKGWEAPSRSSFPSSCPSPVLTLAGPSATPALGPVTTQRTPLEGVDSYRPYPPATIARPPRCKQQVAQGGIPDLRSGPQTQVNRPSPGVPRVQCLRKSLAGSLPPWRVQKTQTGGHLMACCHFPNGSQTFLT